MIKIKFVKTAVIMLLVFVCGILNVKAQNEWSYFSDTLVLQCKKAGDYEKLLTLQSDRRKQLEIAGITKTPDYALVLLDICESNTQFGNKEITDMLETALDVLEQNKPSLMDYKIVTGSLERALKQKKFYYNWGIIRDRKTNYFKTMFGETGSEYGEVLVENMDYYLTIGKGDKALECGYTALDVCEPITGDLFYLFDMAVSQMNIIYSLMERDKGTSFAAEKIALRERGKKRMEANNIPNIENYVINLELLAYEYSQIKQHDKALEIIDKAIPLVRENFGENSKLYADLITDYTTELELSGRRNEARPLVLKNLALKEKLLDENDKNYLRDKYDIASRYTDYFCHDDASRVASEIVLYCENKGVTGNDYAKALETLARYKLNNEDYADCIELSKKAVEIRSADKDNKYFLSLMQLARTYDSLGDYLHGLEIMEQAMKDIEGLFANSPSTQLNPDLLRLKASIHLSLSASLRQLGNIPKSATHSREHLLITSRLEGTEIPSEVLRELDYEIRGEKPKYTDEDFALLEYFKECELEDLKAYGYLNTPDHAEFLCSSAGGYIAAEKFDKAKECLEEGLAMYDKLGYSDKREYGSYLEILAMCLWNLGEKEAALENFQKCMKILEGKIPENHPVYLRLLTNVAVLEYLLDLEQSVHHAVEASTGLRQILISSFSQLTALERNMYWDMYKDWFQRDLMNIAYKFSETDATLIALDGVLLSKGLLLNTEIELTRLISESDDKQLLNKFYKLCALRSDMNKNVELTIEEYEAKSAQTEAIEKELIKASKAYGDYTGNLDIHWQQVRDNLKSNSVAIEFVSFPHDNDSVIYAAYVISPVLDKPEFVKLFENKELASIRSRHYYTQPQLSKLVWSKLDKYISGVENVYFAPAGQLYNIAIESLPDYSGEGLISDKHNFVRLSSTRQLAVMNEKNSGRDAVLYGGLKFDSGVDILIDDVKKYPEVHGTRKAGIFDSEFAVRRDGVDYLPATVAEVQSIEKSLSSSRLNPAIYMAEDGTEASFKNLSGKKVNLIHIATHGFYWTESEAERMDKLSFLHTSDNALKYMEDKALTRSGMLFTGANNALSGAELPPDAENGILTAKEIALLDLRGLDMVVLSACQTGLGEITGEGVFGLQRGFKKAGAKTIMMSLRNVYDDATQLLMSRFYDNLATGNMTKSQALKEAQNYLRNYTRVEKDPRTNESVSVKPYESAECWGAFILLDATD